MQQTYDYFKELVEQLNVLKPEFPRQYAVPGVPEFRSLRWDGGRAHGFRGTQVGAQLARLERVALNYVLSGGGPIRLEREYPASDRLKTLLNDYKIAFTAKEQYNARGSLERVNFEVPLTVDAGLQLTAKLDEGKIQINATHIGGFGVMRRLLAPEAITQAALHELSGFILGETSGRLPRLLQGGE
ncbi:MAG: hypothetical protein FJY56_13710 [Betaproteobacteria bacterium]|nr:hypothetical protein [Betaproteobacteria bacterium]